MLPKIIRTGIHRYEGTGGEKQKWLHSTEKHTSRLRWMWTRRGNPPSPYLVGQRCNLSNRPDSIQMPRHIQKVGGGGIRYTVQIRGKESFLFHEGDKWFVEAKEDNCS